MKNKKCKNNHSWYPAKRLIKGKVVKGGYCPNCKGFFPFDDMPVTPRSKNRITRYC